MFFSLHINDKFSTKPGWDTQPHIKLMVATILGVIERLSHGVQPDVNYNKHVPHHKGTGWCLSFDSGACPHVDVVSKYRVRISGVPLSLPLIPAYFLPSKQSSFRMVILYMELAIHSLSTLLRENSHLKFLWRRRFAGLSGSLFYAQYYFLPLSLPSVIQPR